MWKAQSCTVRLVGDNIEISFGKLSHQMDVQAFRNLMRSRVEGWDTAVRNIAVFCATSGLKNATLGQIKTAIEATTFMFHDMGDPS